MNCTICKTKRIGPETEPFGGYLCSNDHLQCNQCNFDMNGHCGNCHALTKFLQMKFDSPKSPSGQIEPLSQLLPVFPKQMSDEIETQSRLSKEHLTMKCSEQSITKQRYEEPESLVIGAQPFEGPTLSKCSQNHQRYIKSAERFSEYKSKELTTIPEGNSDIKKKNIFLFKVDPDESELMNKSELRFLDSNESFQNVYVDSAVQTPTSSFCYKNTEQQKSLSTKVLHDFDTQNNAIKTEVLNTYLETYSPAVSDTSPAYNCKLSDCHFSADPRKQKVHLEMKDVSVSTNSDPSLQSACLHASANIKFDKIKPQEYLIMQAVGITSASQRVQIVPDKNQIRMQKILEVYKENVGTPKFLEKPVGEKMPIQIPANNKLGARTEILNSKQEGKYSDLIDQLINTYRAYYNPPCSSAAPVNNLHLLPQPRSAQQQPPPQQFQSLPCYNALVQELLHKQTKFSKMKTVPAYVLAIPRSPILCPESTCQHMIFVSDFNKHLVVDHGYLPMERIIPFQCKNFFLDARLFKSGASKCHLLYLMCDKIVGLGSSEYKDFLPILVMTARISLNQICGLGNLTPSAIDYFLIWVTGIAPEELSISVSITVWSRSGRVPSCHIVYSGKMYSIRNSQSAFDVWQSGKMLLLSAQEMSALTDNGKEMLNLQLSVH